MSDKYSMEFNLRGRRKINWKWLGTGRIEKKPLWVGFDPSFRSPDLLRRFMNCTLKPSFPVQYQIASIRKCAVFVRKEHDVSLEDDKEITYCFAIPENSWSSLVTIYAWITPQRQKRLVTELLEITSCGCNTIAPLDTLLDRNHTAVIYTGIVSHLEYLVSSLREFNR